VIQRADHFVNYLGISVADQVSCAPGLPSLEIPGYSYDAPEVLERFQREWKELRRSFSRRGWARQAALRELTGKFASSRATDQILQRRSGGPPALREL